ncbi:hypothetical protein CEP52_002494 [Fusarium oligoseptatum]|uniref:Uncharacterized protein n=1 Tax=Fusarium oligoseptatum TaxID=2604345 RepID=A0A428UDP0_9HYPO|nr:hypothetical protein CEP52_002494 [Fusarium oligoseptatum]
MTRFISLFLLLCSLQKGFAAKQCYYPNGEESPDHPCDEDAEVSACCGGSFGSICMSNKLCAGGDGGIVRGSCTDKNWASPECPLYCLGADTGGTDLVGCSNVTNTDTSYCCDHNANCCDNGVGRFNVYPSKPKPWATWNRQATEYLVVGTMYTGDAASSTAEATTTATSESSSAATTSEAITSSTGEAQASEPTEAPAPGLSTGAQAGIGVGVGVGALVVAAVIYLFWKMRKNEKGG